MNPLYHKCPQRICIRYAEFVAEIRHPKMRGSTSDDNAIPLAWFIFRQIEVSQVWRGATANGQFPMAKGAAS